MALPVSPCLSLSLPVFPCLSLSLSVSPCLSLSLSVSPCLSLSLPISPSLSLVFADFHSSLLAFSCFYLSLLNSLTCEIYLSLSLFLPDSPWLSLDLPIFFYLFFNPLISICFLFFFISDSLCFSYFFQFLFSNPFFFFASMRQLVLNYETSLVRVMNDPKRKSGGRPLKDASHTINQQGSFLSSMCRGYTRSNALCACLFVSMLNWWRVVSIVDKRLSVFYTMAWNYHFSRIIFSHHSMRSIFIIYIYLIIILFPFLIVS